MRRTDVSSLVSTGRFRRARGRSPHVLRSGIASDAADAWSVGVLLYGCESALELGL